MYKKHTGERTAHQISTITLIIFFALYIGYIIQHYPPSSAMSALLIVIMWMLMTLVFEFGFERSRGNSWQMLLKDYDLSAGRIWIFILVWLATAPYIFYKLLK